MKEIMKTFKRILGFGIVISFILAVLVITIIESVEDITYLWFLLGAYGICAIFLFGTYLILKSYEKKD